MLVQPLLPSRYILQNQGKTKVLLVLIPTAPLFYTKKVLIFENHSVSDWTVIVLMMFSEQYAYSDQCFIRNTVAHGIN